MKKKYSMLELADAEIFLEKFCALHEVDFRPNGELYSPSLGNLDQISLFDAATLTWSRAINELGKKKPHVADARFRSAIRKICSIKAAESLEQWKTQWNCTQENDLLIPDLIEAYTGQRDTPQAHLDVAVISHWICNVKRNILGIPARNHMLPVLFGKQGCGKSEAVRRLIKPLKGFTISIHSLECLTDERRYFMFENNYVGFCDEFVQGNKVRMDALKGFLTEEMLTYRKLGSHQKTTIRQRCSFIAATDKPLAWQLHDPQGVRRFYEIKCMDQMKWDVINILDYGAIWRGINENRNYLAGYQEALSASQQSLEAPDSIKEFLRSYAIRPAHASDGMPFSFASLLNHYIAFCNNHEFRCETKEMLARRLIASGFEPDQRRLDGVKCRLYYIQKGNTLSTQKHLHVVP